MISSWLKRKIHIDKRTKTYRLKEEWIDYFSLSLATSFNNTYRISMKKTIFASLAILSFAALLLSCNCTQKQEKVLRHVVMFGFKPEVSAGQIKEVEEAFCALPSQIDLIKGYEWGTDCSPEGLQQGLTHCFFLTFHSDADRDAYLIHPAHKAFGKVLGDKASAVTVVDYWTK